MTVKHVSVMISVLIPDKKFGGVCQIHQGASFFFVMEVVPTPNHIPFGLCYPLYASILRLVA